MFCSLSHFRYLSIAALFWLLTIPASQAGVIINDTVIAKDGREWAQVDLFLDFTWEQVNDACPAGTCPAGAMLNGWLFEGWEWASVDVVQNLFNTYTGETGLSPSEFYEEGQTWTTDFLADFRAIWEPEINRSIEGGWSSSFELRRDSNFSFPPRVWGYVPALQEYPPFQQIPLSGYTLTSLTHFSERSFSQAGAWFVRSTSIPLAGSLWLVLLALAAGAAVRASSLRTARMQ